MSVHICRALRFWSAWNTEASETLHSSSKWLPDVLALLNSPEPDTRNAEVIASLVLAVFFLQSSRHSVARASVTPDGCSTCGGCRWHAGEHGARLAGTLFKQRKCVCFYSSGLGAWAGILCHFPVLGAIFSRKTASPFAAKHSSSWPASMPLILSGLSGLETGKLNSDLV